MNKGVNPKSTYLTKQIGNAGVVKINLNKNEGGFFLDIPLISTPGYDNVNLNLHYSSFNNRNYLFGIGFKLNLFKNFFEEEGKITVKDSFDAETEFFYSGYEGDEQYYKNDDYQYILIKSTDLYAFKDIDGSTISYNISNSGFNSAKNKSRDLVKASSLASYYVFGNYSLLITLNDENNMFETIQLMNADKVVKEVRITYSSNLISSISYYSLNEQNVLDLLSTNTYEFSNSKIKIKDGLSKYYVEFLSNNNFLHTNQINEGYEIIEPYRITNITFLDSLENTTRVFTNYNSIEYFTDYIFYSNDLIKTVINNYGLSQSFAYDNNNNITQKSKILSNTYSDQYGKSLICDYFSSLSTFLWKKSDSSQVNTIIDDNRYSNLIGDKSLVIDPSDSVYYYRDYLTTGQIGEFYTLKLWTKRASGSEDLHLKIIISSVSKNQELEFTLNNNDYGVDVIQFQTSIKYSKIRIELHTSNNTIYYVNNLTMDKSVSIEEYEYINHQITTKKYGENKVKYSYNEKGLINTIVSLNKLFEYQRNENNYINKTEDSNGIITTIEYDEFYKPIKERIEYENDYMEQVTTYNGNFVQSTIDKNNINTTYDINPNSGNTNKISNTINNNTINCLYDYNKSNDVIFYRLNKNNSTDNLQEIEYSYSYTPNSFNQKINEIKIGQNTSYLYYYDPFDRLIKVVLKCIDNETKIETELETYSYSFINNIPTNQLSQINKMDGISYRLVYDEINYNLLSKVYLVKDNIESLLESYEYDVYGNMIRCIKSAEHRQYTYDLQNQLTRYKESYNSLLLEETYQYNELGNLTQEKRKTNFFTDYYVLEPVKEKYEGINHLLYYKYWKYEEFYSTFFYDLNYPGYNSCSLFCLKNNEISKITPIISEQITDLNGLNVLNVSNYGLKYMLPMTDVFSQYITANVSIAVWFYPTKRNSYIISIGSGEEKHIFNFIYNYNNKLELKTVNYDGEEGPSVEFNTTINYSDWNFVGVTIQSTGVYSYKIIVQINDKQEIIENMNFSIDYTKIGFLAIGTRVVNEEIDRRLVGYIANVIFSTYKILDSSELQGYYYTTLDYIQHPKEIIYDKNEKVSSYSHIIHDSILNANSNLTKAEVYPLYNSFNSIDNKEPYHFTPGIYNEKYKYFKYNEEIGHFAYFPNDATMVHNVSMSDQGMVIQRVFIQDSSQYQTISEISDNSSGKIRIFLREGTVRVNLHGTEYDTNLTIENNIWNTVLYTWYTSSNPQTIHLTLKINNTSFFYSSTNSFSHPMWLTIGNNYSGSMGLKGLICDVAYVGGYYFSSGNIYDNYIKTMTYNKKINEFGQLYKKNYLKGISNIYNVNYEYNKIDRSNNIKQLTNMIKEETHNYGNQVDKLVYTYDQLGRIATINSYENNIHSYYKQYTYTEDSSLLNDVDLRYDTAIIYEYDNRGNITKISEYGTQGSSYLKITNLTYYNNNALKSFGDTTILYDNYLRPIEFGIGEGTNYTKLKSLIWNNNKLQQIVDEANNITYSYTYDLISGQRTSKTVDNVTTNFYYSGDLLIYETDGTNYKKYIYDENNLLVELEAKYNNTKYNLIYERDITGNIIGLIDYNGNKVVKYYYRAFGNDIRIEGSLSSIAHKINSFIYKGYYYDVETGYFWLSSRYYSPELCRFISPDDVEYLDPESINGLNLYAYCGNDPVNRYDPTGHAWDTILDFISIAWSAYDLYKNPTWENVGWLALDIVFAVVPFLTGSRIMKAASKLDDVSDIGGYMNKFDNVYDSIVIGNDMGRVTNLAFDTGSMIYDGYKPMNALYAMGRADEITDAMRYAAKVDNARFIMDKYKAGYKIINAGSDGRGFFKMMKSAYGMELKILYRLKYGNKLHKLWWILNSGRRIIW